MSQITTADGDNTLIKQATYFLVQALATVNIFTPCVVWVPLAFISFLHLTLRTNVLSRYQKNH